MRRYYENEKKSFELETDDQKTWFRQIEWVLPYCRGFGLDIGSAGRTLHHEMICLDASIHVCPQVVGDGCHLPFRDKSFDFVFSNQSVEHMDDTEVALLEWLRVSKSFVCVVGPDVRIHGVPGSECGDPGHKYMYTGPEFFELVQFLPNVKIVESISEIGIWADFACIFERRN